MQFSHPAPKRGGISMSYLRSPRDGPTSPRSTSTSSSNSPTKSPAKRVLSAPSSSPAKRRGGSGATTRITGKVLRQSEQRRGSKRTRSNEVKVGDDDDEDDVPRLVGRPERWTIAQHDLSICQWSGFGWAQCDSCSKWRKPSVSGIDLDVGENDHFVCSDNCTSGYRIVGRL